MGKKPSELMKLHNSQAVNLGDEEFHVTKLLQSLNKGKTRSVSKEAPTLHAGWA